MSEEKLYEYIVKIESKLSSIDAKVDGVMATMQDHARRIAKLEDVKSSQIGSTLKDRLLEYTLKAIIGLVGIVAALTGAGSILGQFFKQ